MLQWSRKSQRGTSSSGTGTWLCPISNGEMETNWGYQMDSRLLSYFWAAGEATWSSEQRNSRWFPSLNPKRECLLGDVVLPFGCWLDEEPRVMRCLPAELGMGRAEQKELPVMVPEASQRFS